ncbi:MAG: tetratricopeptide repeat protein [Thermodesulfobacteriota bacterium]|nr:tetratricopeptide repeat protein [Thermodesulfobacteriota bacterium]
MNTSKRAVRFFPDSIPFFRIIQAPHILMAGLFLLSCLVILLLTGCADKEEKFSEHFQNGLTYASNENYNAAVIEFRNAVALSPKHADARYQLGLSYLKTGEPGKALQELERAATLDPENTDAQIKTAELYFLGQRLRESRDAIDRMLAVNPDAPGAYALLAQIELREENTGAAVAAITKALALKPDNSDYYIIKARILSASEQFEEAEQLLKKAVDMSPEPENLQVLAAFYISRQENEKAEQTLKQMVRQYPDRSDPYLELAKFYMIVGRQADAEANLQGAIEKDPDSAGLYIVLGNFYRGTKTFEKAEKAYKTAIEKSETPAGAKTMLADLYFENQKKELATDLVNDVLEKTPDHAGANLVRAKLLVANHKEADAMEILDKLVQENPKWGDAYYVKAIAHLNRGETAESLDATNQAIKYASRNPEIRTLLAHHLFLKQDFEGARNNAAIALQQTPSNFRAGVVLAKSLLALGDTEKAINAFEKMAAYRPNDVEILFNQAIAYLVGDKVSQAETVLEKLIGLKPDFSPALRMLSGLLVQQQKADQAIQMVRDNVDKSGENADNLLLLAELLNAHTKLQNEALDILDRAQQIAPENPRVYALTARILKKQGKTQEAIEKYKILTSQNPDAAEAFMIMGTLMDEAGDREGAKDAYLKALDIKPDFAAAANNLAWLIADSPNPDLAKALRMAMTAKENAPADPFVADTLGWVHYKRGAYQLAISQFSQATEKKPDMPTLRYHLALALHADGQIEKARTELQKCLASKQPFPESSAARQLLESI